jgi:hypothetical protein
MADSLAQRGRVASQNRRQHFAEGPGTDGAPYSENDQGVQEPVFITQTPPAGQVQYPEATDPQISNTENNLVAALQASVNQTRQLAATLDAFQKNVGVKVAYDENSDFFDNLHGGGAPDPSLRGKDPGGLKVPGYSSNGPGRAPEKVQYHQNDPKKTSYASGQRTALDDGDVQETADVVNPLATTSAGEPLTGPISSGGDSSPSSDMRDEICARDRNTERRHFRGWLR